MFLAGLRNRRGASLVLTVVFLVVLLGIAALVIDVGRLYVGKQRAQNVADAASLAGAWKLDGTPACCDPATAEADDVAAKNNDQTSRWKVIPTEGGDTVTVSFPSGDLTLADGSQVTVNEGEAIRVDCKVPVNLLFAPIYGINSGGPTAHSITLRRAVASLTSNLVPWCVADTTLWSDSGGSVTQIVHTGDPVTIKITNPSDPMNFLGPGNFLAVAYSGERGGSNYRDRIAGEGQPIEIGVGQTLLDLNITTEPGDKIGPTNQGLDNRLEGDTWTFDTWKQQGEETGTYPDTPRIVVVPIIADPADPVGGRKPLEVVGFAGFFVESYDNKTGVTGRFISAVDEQGKLIWGLDAFGGSQTTLVTNIKLVG